MTDSYVTVTTVLRAVRDLSIYVDRRKGNAGDQACIPRSLLHGKDDLDLAKAEAGAAITLRVRRWKADELGLIEDKDVRQKEMFG